MYILFLDESGTPPASVEAAKGQRFFVIGGLVIPAAEWRTVALKLQGIKNRHGLRGELKWRFFSPGNKGADNPMAEMDFATRDAIRFEALKIITDVKSIRVIASITSVAAAFDMATITTADDLYRLTYKTVTERFQYYLQDLKKQTGSEEFGMVVSDHRSPDNDRALRAHHHRLIGTKGLYSSQYPNLIETIFFAPSHLSTGVQLADIVAGCIWRKYERDDPRCFDLIAPAVRKNTAGVTDGYGLIKVPKRGWR